MNLRVIGCSHHNTPIALRERLAFSPEQTRRALVQFRQQFPDAEAVLLSTCNRVELYAAAENGDGPTRGDLVTFLADRHGLDACAVDKHLDEQSSDAAVRHLFTVASSLDSMVVGEPQILSQVKQAYQIATEEQSAGPVLHAAFQAALKTARRVAFETTIHQRRVSVPSVAVADFAQQIFERFDDKRTLVIGAGEMAEETLRYLRDQGAREVTVVNRSPERAEELARRWEGRAVPWSDLLAALSAADLVISTTGAEEPIVTLAAFQTVEAARGRRPLFVLDLAVPRDFDPAIGDRPEVYLYSVDDLRQACQRNRAERDKELPSALRIIEQETARFMGDLHHRATAPVIRRLQQGWQKPKEDELRRLFNKLPQLDDHARNEIRESFDRLVNKLLHPPLESLRDEARHGIPHALLDALSKLFQLKD
ncbi:MAG: glutamyl-tRNA reductase [Thermoguttaceae bacterium]|jgi:glutamyl-tRNA reductase|nr:glutamyl-tRNA reductase [Thermoguttaceae bacterium]